MGKAGLSYADRLTATCVVVTSEADLSSLCASLRVDVKVLHVIVPAVDSSVIRLMQHLIACLCKQIRPNIAFYNVSAQ